MQSSVKELLSPASSQIPFTSDEYRLVSVREGMVFLGVRSRTTYHKLIREKKIPPLIKRGTRSYHLLGELIASNKRLAAERDASGAKS